MIITGTITQAGEPSEPAGIHKVRYQNVSITDPTGQIWSGRIGSKQGYQTNTPISITVEEKRDNDGVAYNYFRKHNPQYAQQQASQQSQQSRQAPQSQNSKKEVDWDAKECRGHRAMCAAYAKDLVVAEKLDLDDMDRWVKAKVTFIWDGLVDRGGQPNPNWVGDNPDEPTDDIPY